MTETRPSCPSCQSISVVKNGSTLHGKQNYKCRDCNRQFVENLQWQKVSERVYDNYELLERLLLEKIPLARISKVDLLGNKLKKPQKPIWIKVPRILSQKP